MLAHCESCDQVVDLNPEELAAARVRSEQDGFSPDVDIEDRGDRFVLMADLPGVRQSETSVEVKDGILVLSGTRQKTDADDSATIYRAERRQGGFTRRFHLGALIDLDGIEARFNSGVLPVDLPKAGSSALCKIL